MQVRASGVHGSGGAVRAERPGEARFAALDGWRGVCALMVVFLHAPVETAFTRSGLVANAFLFVDFFFVLSGFVIAHAFAARLARTRDWRGFAASRLRRVYPLHLVMLALFLLFEVLTLALRGPGEAFQGGDSLPALVQNLLMTHSLGTLAERGWNYPSWSISAELVAYGVFAAAVLIAGRRLVPVLALVALGGAVFVALRAGSMDATVEAGWARCFFGFGIGALLRLVLWPRMAPADAAHRAWWTLAEGATVLLVLRFVSEAGTTPLGFAAPFVFAYAILVFAHEGGALSRLMRSPPFAFLGLVSYSIYMTHAFVIARLMNAATIADERFGLALMTHRPDGSSVLIQGEPAGWLALSGVIAGTILLSALTWRFVELPGQRLGRRRPVARPDERPMTAPLAQGARS